MSRRKHPFEFGQTSVFFLILFLVDKASTKQGCSITACVKAGDILAGLLKATALKVRDSDLTVLDLVMGGHLSTYGDCYYPTEGIVSNNVAEKLLPSLGVPYPHHLPGGFNSPQFTVDAECMLRLLLRVGELPYAVACAAAALVSDGLSQGEGTIDYTESTRDPKAKRQKTNMVDKGVAFFRMLNNITKGIKHNTGRPFSEEPKPTFSQIADAIVAKGNAVDTESFAGAMQSQQTSEVIGKAQELYQYKEVVSTGMALL